MGELTATELKQELKVSDTTLWRWRKEGLPFNQYGYKTIRYNLEDVKAWLKENKGIE
ncbi:helix-turn-helix domain-containing protein (plasmid) [Sutcliffiella horikoshii]|uniref:helix-turn-helix transcriptional regulator n=1 Tax=Sutcliffiella horikoshii TaxID=79883 RepID=UPI001CBE9B83|nr:helix-turn-helix domain-containing protein [Sutcliffiella horikoshii]UAL49737.1 helix-turn-helix domain-containing protein [Sutcliffiella horikoshii]